MNTDIGALAIVHNPTPAVLTKCQSLQITNPAYVSAIRFGSRFAANQIPKTLPGCTITANGEYIHAPRDWFIREVLQKMDVTAGLTRSVVDVPAEYPCPTLELFDYQNKAADAYFSLVNQNDALNLPTDATIVLATSGGKTILGMLLAYHSRCRALVVVPTQEIEAAWVEDCCRIFQIQPEDIGRIRGKKLEIGKFFTIGSIQTLMKLDPTLWADKFGITLFDEAHRLPGASFVNVLRQAKSRLRVGLTATDKRKDGMMPAVRWHLGQNCYYDITPRNSVPLMYMGVISDYSCPPTKVAEDGEPIYEYTDVLGKLCTSKIRLPGIVALVQYIRENYGGHILISSARVEHIEQMEEVLRVAFPDVPIAVLTGQQKGKGKPKRKELYQQIKDGEYPITIATQSIVSEGASNPKWWHLIQTTPVSDPKTIEQLKGRPIRIDPNDSSKKFGYFWDIVDNIVMCRNMGRTRFRVLQKHCKGNQWFTLSNDYKNKIYTIEPKGDSR
jgi:superfamily II DNA or RNA helicase